MRWITLFLLPCGALLLSPLSLQAQELPPPDDATLTLANPAAGYCIDNGGQYEIRDGDKGQFGVCILPDGQEIDAWDYFRQQQSEGSQSQ